jgi:membrane protease YdiL (CAAX protease family)
MQAKIYVAAASQVLSYILTLAVSFPLFPLLWHYSFLNGIHWTWRQARLHGWKLVLLGFALSGLAQLCEHFVKLPHGTDVMELFHNPLSAWLTVCLGGLLVPAFEEIAFRGFLLPALATAYDWLSLERTPAARMRWQQTVNHTRGAWIFSSILTSILFVAMHAPQLHNSFGALSILFVPSIVFCAVRIRYRSVAAATLVHMAYDSLIFLEMIIATGGFRHLDKLAG